jgi:transcriptional regulator with XRE-family HTH domain
MSTFSERLKIAIKESGKTQKEIGFIAGFSESNMSHFLSGERGPGIDSVDKLLRALPLVDARWLITGLK